MKDDKVRETEKGMKEMAENVQKVMDKVKSVMIESEINAIRKVLKKEMQNMIDEWKKSIERLIIGGNSQRRKTSKTRTFVEEPRMSNRLYL